MENNVTREIFAKNLRRIADEKRITQADIVAQTKCSSAAVSDWFNGKKYPRPNRMQRIADILGVCMSDLIEEYPSPKKTPVSESKTDARLDKIIDQYHNMNVDGQVELAKYADYISTKPEYSGTSAQSRTILVAARGGGVQRMSVNQIDNIDDLLPPAEEDPTDV